MQGCRLVSAADLIALIDARPPHVELLLTGRNAPGGIQRAGLVTVTDLKSVSHYYEKGVSARKGIES